MYLAQIHFGSYAGDPEQREDLEDTLDCYLAGLVNSGQIGRDYLAARSRGGFVAYVAVPRPNALDERFHTSNAMEDRETLTAAFGAPPRLELLEDDIPERFPALEGVSSLYLYAYWGSKLAPIRSGDDGSVVPAYLLPLATSDKQQITGWFERYRRFDHIWLESGEWEMKAYRETVDPHSELCREGRDHCAAIEQASGKPTYLFMQRYYGRRTGEENRVCPRCGQPWRDETVSLDDEEFYRFLFRCEPCRLVGHLPESIEDERHARIGEYRPNAKRRRR